MNKMNSERIHFDKVHPRLSKYFLIEKDEVSIRLFFIYNDN